MITVNFNPFPVITTANLVLRRPTIADVDELFLYRSDKDLMQYIPHRLVTSKEEIVATIKMINERIILSEGINWAITLKGDDTIIGMVGYVSINTTHHRAEIGYMLHTPYHGKGIIQEAFTAAINFGFQTMKLHSIEAVVNHENIASKKLLERNGFTKDAFFEDYLFHNGKYTSVNVYSLLAPKK